MKYTTRFLSLSVLAFLGAVLGTTTSQARLVAGDARPHSQGSTSTSKAPAAAEVNCNLYGGPFLYFISTTLNFEGTQISQSSTIWFSADHVYCTQIKAPADCNTLKFFDGQYINGQLITLPAQVKVTSIVLGAADVSSFACKN